ncbi:MULTISPECIES: hypothetical protein [Halomonas]|uniref:hypothetical protein n=1 Tax=Halomonas TaxID=2745 RepID=UPI003CE81C7C
MTEAHVISGETANRIVELLGAYQRQAEHAGGHAFAHDLGEMIAAINDGKACDALASVAVAEIASGNAAYCIWVEEELNGCPHDAVTDIAKSAGSRIIDDFIETREPDDDLEDAE